MFFWTPAVIAIVLAMARAKNQPPLGPRLRQLRQAAGLTQLQLAERAGVADATVSRIERGRIASPSMDFAEALADALGVPVVELFEATKKIVPDGLRLCDRRLLAIIRDLDEAAVDDVARAVKLLLSVGRRGAARR